MRSQTSVTLVSLLIASVAVGLQQVEYRLSGLKTLFVQPFIPSDSYLCRPGKWAVREQTDPAPRCSRLTARRSRQPWTLTTPQIQGKLGFVELLPPSAIERVLLEKLI
ncbi:MAG: hypothetical protein HC936_17755 [Leptolyngbyaceae cyanobacterium SU_3_3]|nr:hypothetical protein [Leptolyngbyaceae cyanobacterium SU_3_3]